MNFRMMTLATSAAAVLTVFGCGSEARYVTNESDQIVSIDQLDLQDFRMAAREAVNELLESGEIERAPQQPAVIKVTQVVNETDERFNRALLTQDIEIALRSTGRIIVMSSDPETRAIAEEMARREGRELPLPYYTLSGRVLQRRAEAGSTRQNAYVFQLDLATTRDGLNVKSTSADVVKQGSRNSVGF